MMDPQPTPEDLHRFYSPEAGYHAEYSNSFIAKQRSQFLLRIHATEKLLSDELRPVRVLDIGAANGLFLDCAKENGWKTEGIEMNRSNADHCRNNGHIMSTGSFDDYEGAPSSFSVIHMGDVIEHMLDPRAAVKKSHALLAPKGLLIMATPDADSLFAKISLPIARFLNISWPHALPPAHTFQFSEANLTLMLNQEGFDAVHRHSLPIGFMEEMRETEYFETIYMHIKKRRGTLAQFIKASILFCLSAIIYFIPWAIGELTFPLTKKGAHVTVWYQKR
jgi:2-polyprenyl-3-methyl-5-hydroxy-6-metoxy-1,4-benzoquinol methylase